MIAAQKRGAKKRVLIQNTQMQFEKTHSFFGEKIVEEVINQSRAVVFGMMRDHSKLTQGAKGFISFGDKHPTSAGVNAGKLYFSIPQCGRIGMWVAVYLAFTVGQAGQRSQFFTQLCAGQFVQWYPTEGDDKNGHSRIQTLAVTDVPMSEKVDSRKGQPILVRKKYRDDVKLVAEFISKFATGKSLKWLAYNAPMAPLLPHYKNSATAASDARVKPKKAVREAGNQ